VKEQEIPKFEADYLDLLAELADIVTLRDDRTGTGTRSVFGRKMTIANGPTDPFPLLSSKNVHVRSVIEELAWMLLGDTNAHALQARGVRIWNEWAREDGSLGPVYGAQWRNITGHNGERLDQLASLVWALVHDPWSRRHIVSAWNVADLPLMALAPCHMMMQWYVRRQGHDRILDLQVYQRSADVFLGLPFNLASYSFLLRLVAALTGYIPGTLSYVLGDVHLYHNHLEQAREQLSRRGHDALRASPVVLVSDAAAVELQAYRDRLMTATAPLSSEAFDLAVVTWRDGVTVESYKPLGRIAARVAV